MKNMKIDWDEIPISIEDLEELVFDRKLYPRKDIDYSVIHRYAKALKSGSTFPPIKVGLLHGKKIIVDGVHRVRSRESLEMEQIECRIRPFESEGELFAEAIKWNIDHGRPFRAEDIRANITRLKRYDFSIEDIRSLLHVPASDIYRETTKSVTAIKAPCGRKIYCNGKPDYKELIRFKKALMLIRDVGRTGCIPNEEPFTSLMRQCREVLGRLKSNRNNHNG